MALIEIQFGLFKGKKLKYPDRIALRPSLARVRDVLFNWLGNLSHKKCLDLFAGTGILGIQSLCLGAEYVDFVEADRPLADALKIHLETMRFSTCAHVTYGLAAHFLKNIKNHPKIYDIIFLDPPFDNLTLLDDLWAILPMLCNDSTIIYLEHPKNIPFKAPCDFRYEFIYLKNKQIGEVSIYLIQYRRKANTG
ncbi:MAG: hypothetical protein FJ161_00735 [Gammaproteobacteria bacterium]|nr:hypothetical protein [Gammaproteobacteria bacterium]